MLSVDLCYDQEGIYVLEARGHTEVSDKGSDIACAGASSVIQTALLGLHRLAPGGFALEQEEGYIYLSMDSSSGKEFREKARIILDTMVLGLERIALLYPLHIRITRNYEHIENNKISEGGVCVTEQELLTQEQDLQMTGEKKNCPFSFEKLFGVALLGAVSGLLVYYIYHNISAESRTVVKEAVIGAVRTQIARIAAEPQEQKRV